MRRHVPPAVKTETAAGSPSGRFIAGGRDWTLSEFVCHAGPHDRRFEERHDRVAIAAVIDGSFTYRADSGRALLYPGSFLLGNFGSFFECGHDHSTGDRCISIQFSPEYFAEISAAAAGSGRYLFSTATLPAAKNLTSAIVDLESIAGADLPLRTEEAVASIAETVLSAISGHTPVMVRTSARDERRVVEVLRYIQTYAAEPLDLDRLATVAGVSKYHFLRTFRRAVGISPYQFLLTFRLRQAARRLRTSSDSVTSIGLESGFGDLSTFNGHFRTLFGLSPRKYRES
jgi:AraC family transcriptional regulator